MSAPRIAIVGGGAAGFFAAITAAESAPAAEIHLLERSSEFLGKVRISGGGRCNVTHACFDVREMKSQYPRGGSALSGPLSRFQAQDTIEWFAKRGVSLKTESDGRMFPVSDKSDTIIDCLVNAARSARVQLLTRSGVDKILRRPDGSFVLHLSNGTQLDSDRVLLATGGCRGPAAGHLAVSLGHSLESPVPSLFSLHISVPWLRSLSGTSVDRVEVSLPEFGLKERGPLLCTHWGLSGPAILRLSAWGARPLHDAQYQATLQVHWLPEFSTEKIREELKTRRTTHPSRLVVNSPIAPLSARLWEQLVLTAGIPRERRWAEFPNGEQHRLAEQLTHTVFPVSGKSLNKDEFVTCGGVPLNEVDFRTMESRVCHGLFFAGELLNVDGVTGGFNFQAAWTTGWIAGKSMAGVDS